MLRERRKRRERERYERKKCFLHDSAYHLFRYVYVHLYINSSKMEGRRRRKRSNNEKIRDLEWLTTTFSIGNIFQKRSYKNHYILNGIQLTNTC